MVEHRFQYICSDNEQALLAAFRDTAALRYRPLAELRRNRSPYDLARLVKYWSAFAIGRTLGRRALLDDPYAVFAALWLADRLDARVVVLMRDPASLIGSWRRLGWIGKPHELLEQPLLTRDLLGSYEDRFRSLATGGDDLAGIATLWAATYDAVDRCRRADARTQVLRYEDLATDPTTAFAALYESVGLRWDDAARAAVTAATSSARARRAAFAWSLRGGLSRTAFAPMDSRAQLAMASCRLSAAEVQRVREITAAVEEKFDSAGSLGLTAMPDALGAGPGPRSPLVEEKSD